MFTNKIVGYWKFKYKDITQYYGEKYNRISMKYIEYIIFIEKISLFKYQATMYDEKHNMIMFLSEFIDLNTSFNYFSLKEVLFDYSMKKMNGAEIAMFLLKSE